MKLSATAARGRRWRKRCYATMAPVLPPLHTLFKTFSAAGDHSFTASITEEWMQGRTTYGGLSAGICFEAASRFINDDRVPLRSAQVTFVGPAGGGAEIDVTLVRASKAMSFVRAELSTGGKVATSALFAFGAARSSSFDELHIHPAPADILSPNQCPDFYVAGMKMRPVFLQNFEARLARGGRPVTASSDCDNWLWVRHLGACDAGHVDGPMTSTTCLLALADMPPPAIMPKFTEVAPVASVSWHVNLLTDTPRSAPGGWWLLRSRAESARQGYSSQDMTLFGGDGQSALVGRQSVAIYA